MLTVTYSEYMKDLEAFHKKHRKADLQVYTSPLINNTYHKEYCYSDGAVFAEVNEMVHHEEITVDVHGIEIKTTVKMIKHEYWTTETKSKYWYESR